MVEAPRNRWITAASEARTESGGDAVAFVKLLTGVDAQGRTDYEECMTLPRYNISRKTTHGIPFTDMANMFTGAASMSDCSKAHIGNSAGFVPLSNKAAWGNIAICGA